MAAGRSVNKPQCLLFDETSDEHSSPELENNQTIHLHALVKLESPRGTAAFLGE